MKNFKPHMMYDPKTGKAYKANKPEDHERMAKMGYTHEKPEMDEEVTTTANIPNPADTAMGPRFTSTNVMDRRKKKKPALLKRFSQFMKNDA